MNYTTIETEIPTHIKIQYERFTHKLTKHTLRPFRGGAIVQSF